MYIFNLVLLNDIEFATLIMKVLSCADAKTMHGETDIHVCLPLGIAVALATRYHSGICQSGLRRRRSGPLYTVAVGYQWSHYKVTDDTLESSVVDSDVIAWFRLELHSATVQWEVQMPSHPPLSTQVNTAVASSGNSTPLVHFGFQREAFEISFFFFLYIIMTLCSTSCEITMQNTHRWIPVLYVDNIL